MPPLHCTSALRLPRAAPARHLLGFRVGRVVHRDGIFLVAVLVAVEVELWRYLMRQNAK